MTTDLKSYPIREARVSRSITDAMWSWSITVDKDEKYPAIWEDVQLIESIGNTDYCLLRGFPLTNQYKYEEADTTREISGYSYGWYVANRPILPDERLLRSTISGSTIIIEDPVLYLNRLIFGGGTGTPCGLQQGAWENSTPGWGTDDLPYQQFEANDSSTIQSVIDDIADYTGLIHYDHWLRVGQVWTPVSYLLTQDHIDTRMGLPVPLVIYNTTESIQTNQVIPPITLQVDGAKWKNRVMVTGSIQGSSNVYSGLYPATWDITTQGLERLYPYCMTMPPTITAAKAQTLIDKRVAQLYSLLCTPTTTFEVKFWKRFDLQLWQKIRFSGFPNIPDEDMRIVEIEYSWTDDDGGWGAPVCACKCAIDRQWASSRKLALILKSDYWALSDSIKRSVEQSSKTAYMGYHVGYGPGGTAIMRTTSGALVYGYSPNQ